MALPLGGFSAKKLSISPVPDGVSFRFSREEERGAVVDAVLHAQEDWCGIFETCTDPVFVAVENSKIVGFEILSTDGAYYAEHGEKVGAVGCVSVVETARNCGIGRQMVAAGIEWLQSQGAQEIELRYVELVDWYAKLGFTVKHRQWMGEKTL